MRFNIFSCAYLPFTYVNLCLNLLSICIFLFVALFGLPYWSMSLLCTRETNLLSDISDMNIFPHLVAGILIFFMTFFHMIKLLILRKSNLSVFFFMINVLYFYLKKSLTMLRLQRLYPVFSFICFICLGFTLGLMSIWSKFLRM